MVNFSYGNYSGLIIAGFGVIMLLASIFNSNWLFGDNKTFNIHKIAGWANLFGRNVARVIAGIMSLFIIAFGIFWFCFKLS